jgi:hypothetical protein
MGKTKFRHQRTFFLTLIQGSVLGCTVICATTRRTVGSPCPPGRVPASSIQLFRNDDHDYLRHRLIDFQEGSSYPPTFNSSEGGGVQCPAWRDKERDAAAVSETLCFVHARWPGTNLLVLNDSLCARENERSPPRCKWPTPRRTGDARFVLLTGHCLVLKAVSILEALENTAAWTREYHQYWAWPPASLTPGARKPSQRLATSSVLADAPNTEGKHERVAARYAQA